MGIVACYYLAFQVSLKLPMVDDACPALRYDTTISPGIILQIITINSTKLNFLSFLENPIKLYMDWFRNLHKRGF